MAAAAEPVVGWAAAVAQCGALDFDAKVECYDEALLAVLRSAGIRPAMQTLESIAARDADAHHFGHVFAHHIGIVAYEAPDRVGAAFAECTPGFQSGCYHGVIQAYFADLQASGADSSVDAPQLNRLCRDHRGNGGDRWLLFQCVHGIGHGLVALHDHHLPGALAGCDLLEDAWEREGCYGGAFMENIVSATMPHHAPRPDHPAAGRGAAIQPHAHHQHHQQEHQQQHPGAEHPQHAEHEPAGDHLAPGGHRHGHAAAHATPDFKALDPADPHHPCSALDERYLHACYTMQTSAVLFHSSGDISAGIQLCEEAPGRVRFTCYVSLGRDINAYTRQSHTLAIQDCKRVSRQYQPACLTGVAKNRIDITADPADGVAFCQALRTDRNRARCFQAVGEQVAFLEAEPARRWAFCQRLDAADALACRSGAGVEAVAEHTEPQP
jgi:hypothetical protein